MAFLTIKTSKPDWQGFSLQGMPEIIDFASFHRFKPGQIIFYSGHLPYGLYILISGEAELRYINKTETVPAPALIGISGFMDRISYPGKLKAVSDCELYFLSLSSYHKLQGSSHPLETWIKKYI